VPSFLHCGLIALEDATSSMRFKAIHSSEFRCVAGDDQFEKRDGVRIVENQSVVSVLESSLYLSDVVGTLTYVNFTVLGVLHTQSQALPLVAIRFPSTCRLLEVVPALSYRNSDVFIVEKGSVQLQEVDKMLSQVNLVSVAFLVCLL